LPTSLSISSDRGTKALYAAFNTLTGRVIGIVVDKTNGKAFLSFLRLLKRRAIADRDLHIILDNPSAHKTPTVRGSLEAHPRLHLRCMPTRASWLNAVYALFAQ
jgi:transposase